MTQEIYAVDPASFAQLSKRGTFDVRETDEQAVISKKQAQVHTLVSTPV